MKLTSQYDAEPPATLIVKPEDNDLFLWAIHTVKGKDRYTGRTTYRDTRVKLARDERVELVRWIPGTCGTKQFALVRKADGTDCMVFSGLLRG